jgi:pimeloyl-ACP methyl ester carboxylesterase
MITDKINQIIKLKDGRTLGYAEYGASDGKPVFHFHGSSSSRLEHPPDENILPSLGIRFITADRPGHGLSDFHPNRRLLDWPNDVSALADHLSINKFAVSGWSFGGPYAMACAYKIPERLSAVGLISSFAPYDRPGATAGMVRLNKVRLGLARWIPWWLGKQLMKMQGRALRGNTEGTTRKLMSLLPKADQDVLNNPQVKKVLLPSLGEAYRMGADGAAWEGKILVRPWEFRLQDIKVPVHIWHGDADVNGPLQCSEYLRDTIPKTHATFFPNEGHFLIMKRWGEILAELIK